MSTGDFPIWPIRIFCSPSLGLAPPVESAGSGALALVFDLECVVGSGGAQIFAPGTTGMVEIGPSVDDHRQIVAMNPNRKCVGMAMRGDGQESERTVVKNH